MHETAYQFGVQRALIEAGLIKEAGPLMSAVRNAAQASGLKKWVVAPALSTALGAGAGALTAGEGDRTRGALIGGLGGLAFGAGRAAGRGKLDLARAQMGQRIERRMAGPKKSSTGFLPQQRAKRLTEVTKQEMARRPRMPGVSGKAKTWSDWMGRRALAGNVLGAGAGLGTIAVANKLIPQAEPPGLTTSMGDWLQFTPETQAQLQQYMPLAQQAMGITPEMMAQQAQIQQAQAAGYEPTAIQDVTSYQPGY